MIIRGFFTTFLMKQSLGRFGFGKAALGSGLLNILFMTVNFDFSNTKLSISGHSVIRIHSAQEILLDNLSLLSELKNLKIPASLDDKAAAQTREEHGKLMFDYNASLEKLKQDGEKM